MQRHRVEGRDNAGPSMAEHPAVVALDLTLRAQKPPQRNGSESDDHPGLENCNLAVQVASAGAELVGRGVSVLGRMTQDSVGDVRHAPRDPRLDEQLVKDAPGGANKRATSAVLVLARSLAEEKQP